MTARLTFTLPSDVTQRAVRCSAVPIAPRPADAGQLATWTALQDDQAAAAEHAAHVADLLPCPHCQLVGHDIRWRGYPVLDPGPCPPGDVLDDVAEGCHCCFWGSGPTHLGEPLFARLSREAHQGRDVQVEHLDRRHGWTKFDTRFEAA